MRLPRILVGYLLLAVPSAGRADTPSFSKDVAPIFRARCLECHGGAKARGDLRLTSRAALLAGGASGPALKPGKSGDSLLFTHLRDLKMPPKSPLDKSEIDHVRRWIDAGAAWDGPDLAPPKVELSKRSSSDWWSLLPVRRPPIPGVRDAFRVRTPIDAFLLAKLEAKGLSFAPEADRRTLIRRVTFDLHGLAPTPEEINAFVQDARPDAFERLVDRLLASPYFGERYARHWLDVVRFAESHGYEMNTLRPNAWPYRDYVIRAFNRDLPYEEFVREQLAGDLLAKGDFLTASATGFLVGGPHDLVTNATEEGKRQQRADDLADVVATTGTTFLGLTVGCARCHDHKFDPIAQTDFYALQAVFAGVEHAERTFSREDDPARSSQVVALRQQLGHVEKRLDDEEPTRDGSRKRPAIAARRNVERFAPVRARFVRFAVVATTDGLEPCIDELELYGPDEPNNLALATRGVKLSASSTYTHSEIHKLEHLNDGRVGNGRSWISGERGKGWVRLELPNETTLDRVVWGRDREERYGDRLARDYRVQVSCDGATWREVAGSSDRLPMGTLTPPTKAVQKIRDEEKRLRAELTRLTEPIRSYAGTVRAPDVVHRLHRGDVMQRREVVAAGVIDSLPGRLDGEGDRRLALAAWINRPDNPLSPRVLVNRVWQWHFGQGFVRTPNDFGANGDRPSHPELLDWLASEVGRGSLKRLHRTIVLSSAYRQSSRVEPRARALDAENRLVWRHSPRRLEAEAIRDSMLQASGALDTRMGGPGYHLWDYSGYVIVFTPKAKLGPAEFRRMVYQFKPRLQQDGTFGAFDCPDATGTAPRRNVSTTPLQALNLLNDPFVHDQAARFAERVRREEGDAVSAQVHRAFRLAFGREPSGEEQAASARVVERHGLAVLCRALYNANEFVFVP